MKKLLIVFFVFLSMLTFGQNYKLFNAISRKVFIPDSLAELTFGIAFDSVKMVNGDSVYYNYTGIAGIINPDSCEFGGGGNMCYQQSTPSRIGLKVSYNNYNQYKFTTNQGNDLTFNFDIPPGDSSLFYQDESQKFYMVFEGADTATILGIADSAKYYRVLHTDSSGNVINSPLNDEMIVVGKEIGLVDFFRIDNFPQLLKPVHLVGNLSPDAGLYRLTNEMLYDYQPGDVIEYFNKNIITGGPVPIIYQIYIRHNIISRTDTPDSIFYTVAKVTSDKNSGKQTSEIIFLRYKRNEIISEIPFDKIDQSVNLKTTNMYRQDYCGMMYWTYTVIPKYFEYCIAENCWGPSYYAGIPPTEEITYVYGLGKFDDQGTAYSPPMRRDYRMGIIYFKKNGAECGNEVIVNVNEPLNSTNVFTVLPNPAKDYLFVKASMVNPGTIHITNLNGQEIITTSIKDAITKVEIGSLKPGMYLVKTIQGNHVGVKKIIKE